VAPDGENPLDPTHPSDLTVRFAAVLRRPEPPGTLDEACTLLAAHFGVGADPDGTDLGSVRAGLDELAKGVEVPSFTGVVEHLDRVGLGGTPSDYGTAASSMLPDVVRRRRGLPIMLAVVAVEAARRVGVAAAVVGMPGHVLVASVDEPGRLADPFHRRTRLDPDGARQLFERLHGGAAHWDKSFLDPIGPPQVVARVLANLANRYRSDKRHRQEAVALGLRSLVPGVSLAERGTLASALARSGAFDRAAVAIEELADVGGAGTEPDDLRDQATRWRARLN
jgi:hypothetical protein